MRSKTINQYQIIKRLGAGTSGVVYQAFDTTLLRPVVLKMLRSGSARSSEMRETILQEARLASAIEHPNVCSIYEVGESEDRAFIVMQYVPGRTLDTMIASGPLSLPLALSIGLQISDGLAAAHRLGILHRDLKPANIMITEGGLVKILDFGLAKRWSATGTLPVVASSRRKGVSSSAPRGTTAYMAPEQFITGQSSEQTDVFALGTILYEMVTGRHPFVQPESVQPQIARAIQYLDPPSARDRRPDLSPEFEAVIMKALAKQPSDRFSSAAEVREALKTLMKSSQLENIGIPVDLSGLLPASAEPDERAGFLSLLAERFMRHGSSGGASENSVVVFPFRNLEAAEVPPFYGYALAEAIATRLARIPSLVVRPSSSLVTTRHLPADAIEAGKRLSVTYVITGNFLRSENSFVLNWQLLETASGAIRSGGSISIASLDLVAIQTEIAGEIFSTLQGSGQLLPGASRTPASSTSAEVSDDYLQARALLSNFMFRSSDRSDLDQARGKFRAVLARDPQFAPAHSGLGITLLQYVQKGFGGISNLIEANRSFERALAFDPESIEAHLFRVYMFLWRGEKESARQGINQLLETAPTDYAVHIVLGIVLRLDGMYEEALGEFGRALNLNPASATVVYNERARLYHYQGQLELAAEEIDKGLMLEPKHPLLLTSLGYLYLRQSETGKAIATLESVLAENAELRIAYPTLAICYLLAGDHERAASLMTDETLAAAEVDCEMAYRVGTYFAMDANTVEALHWLRKAIYLGNENYPWFARNPAWISLHKHSDYIRVLSDVRKTYRSNVRRWKHLLSENPGAARRRSE